MVADAPFIAGVIEGFYGPPWSWADRRSIIDTLREWGGNWYVWAPKADPRHRDHWRDPFNPDEIDGFASLRGRGIGVSIGLTPGRDALPDDVLEKLAPVVRIADGFTICFDDLDDHDEAHRHAAIANSVRERLGLPVWIVPTHYAGTANSPYLTNLIDGLHPDIAVMWTGSTVVCDTISATEAEARRRVTGGRVPLVWDNTPVNDALMRDLLHLGPYNGREAALRSEISGLLINPMEFAAASRPTIRSAMAWVHGRDHVVEWREECERLGLLRLAEATAFPSDLHWPGDAPDRAWWESVRDLVPVEHPGLERWAEVAREGARIALALLDLDGHIHEPDRVADIFGAIMSWRTWSRNEPSTFGRGPRLRPVFSQGESGRFNYERGTLEPSTSLVDRLVSRILST